MNQQARKIEQQSAPETLAPQSAEPAKKAPDVAAETDVMLSQAEISSATAELLGGAESAEGAEDEKGFGEEEDQSKGKNSSGGGATGDAAAVADAHAHLHPIPPPAVMKKEVAKAIRQEIRKQEREVVFAYIGLKKVQPNKLAEMVSRLRQLRDLLGSIADMAGELMKGLYLKWVRGEGKS